MYFQFDLFSTERIQIYKWLEKLQKISGSKEKLAIRDKYMWLLLLMMQHGYLIEPFNELPPESELTPITEILVRNKIFNLYLFFYLDISNLILKIIVNF